MHMKNREGLTISELLVGLVIATVLATALVRLAADQNQLVMTDEGRGEARSVSRSALTLMESDLRVIEVSDGVVAAHRDSVVVRIPFRMGIVCTAAAAEIVASMLPVDSMVLAATTASGTVSGYAWRNANGTYGSTYTNPSLSNGAASACLNSPANIDTIPGGKVLRITPGTTSAFAGTPIMLFYRVRYSFRASQSMPGTIALWRTVESNSPLHEELAAPFDTSAHFRFYVDGSATAQTAVPSPVTDIRGFELHMTGFNRRNAAGGAAERTPLVTSIFFKNR
jgi:hypothetical protein